MTVPLESEHLRVHQWWRNGDHPDDYTKDHMGYNGNELVTITAAERREGCYEGDVVRYFRHPLVSGSDVCVVCGIRMHDHGWIDSGDDGQPVCPGDIIVTLPVGYRRVAAGPARAEWRTAIGPYWSGVS